MSWHLTSWHLMSWHLTSWQMMSLHMTSWHMMSLHTMSWHMIYDLSWIWEGNYLGLELKTWGSQNCSALQSQDSRIVWQSNCRVACKFLVIFMFGVVFVFVVYSIFGIHLISFVIFNFHFSLFYVSLIFLGPSSFFGWLHFWVILFLEGVFIFGLAFFCGCPGPPMALPIVPHWAFPWTPWGDSQFTAIIWLTQTDTHTHSDRQHYTDRCWWHSVLAFEPAVGRRKILYVNNRQKLLWYALHNY